MIAVIQCAGRKQPFAGHVLSSEGKRVAFVADPKLAPADSTCEYAHPDSWRPWLLDYNTKPGNPLTLYPAYQLYRPKIYARLVEQLGVQNVFILSAGWGLIRADFLTPYYDITFSPEAEPYKRRRRGHSYDDFRMLPLETDKEILFFGGADYRAQFAALTQGSRGRRTVFYNSTQAPGLPGCICTRFETAARTNWHYQCASTFLLQTKSNAVGGNAIGC